MTHDAHKLTRCYTQVFVNYSQISQRYWPWTEESAGLWQRSITPPALNKQLIGLLPPLFWWKRFSAGSEFWPLTQDHSLAHSDWTAFSWALRSWQAVKTDLLIIARAHLWSIHNAESCALLMKFLCCPIGRKSQMFLEIYQEQILTIILAFNANQGTGEWLWTWIITINLSICQGLHSTRLCFSLICSAKYYGLVLAWSVLGALIWPPHPSCPVTNK